MSAFRPKVDYSIRPAKATVRRMIVEALAQLSPLVPVDKYRYIGMGGTYFRDFQIVHRRLGICDMVTIEAKQSAEERIKFNLPLACIKVVMQHTNDALPRMAFEDSPHIIWLDYEGRVDQGVFSDIDEVVGRCASATVLILTVNAERVDGDAREHWLSEIEADRANPRTRKEYAQLSYRALRDQIKAVLSFRNAARPKEKHMKFHQMFHMIHADGAQMLTVGGALIAETDQHRWDKCRIDSLTYTRSGEAPYPVRIPRLTRREWQHLLSVMPDKAEAMDAATIAGIPARDAREFASVYRYAPLFVEAQDW